MKKELLRYLVFGLSVAYIIYMWVSKSLGDTCASMPPDQLLPMAVTSAAVTAGKVIAIAGGVSANSGLREAIVAEGKKRHWRTFLPELKFTTDNAAMIAMAGYHRYQKGEFAPLDIAPVARLEELL